MTKKSFWPWLVLILRLLLFAVIQGLFALSFWLVGLSEAWERAANWWPFVVTLTNFILIAFLVRLYRREGGKFFSMFKVDKKHLPGDILVVLGLFIVGGPLGYFPNPLLAKAIFGDVEMVLPLLVRPLPFWAAYVSLIFFPLSQGLAELPTYFGYAMPRLKAQGMRPWLAITLAALMLGMQHVAVPLLFNWQFILWRGLMFIPFAFFVGIVLHWRPRLMPYFAFIHVLMDLSFALMLLSAAFG